MSETNQPQNPLWPGASDWQPEHVQAFWNYWSDRTPEGGYFGEGRKEALIRATEWLGLLTGRVVDYGCGRGPLFGELMKRGCRVAGVDFSTESVAETNRRWADHDHWDGAWTPDQLQDVGAFDLAYCIEVVEHLDDLALTATWDNLRTLLRPGGRLFLTTPHDEAVQDSAVFCPFCKSQFHRWQHVRRWTTHSIRAALEEAGFEVELCVATDFTRFVADDLPDIRQWNYYTIRNYAAFQALRIWDAVASSTAKPIESRSKRVQVMTRKQGPHLWAIAKRR